MESSSRRARFLPLLVVVLAAVVIALAFVVVGVLNRQEAPPRTSTDQANMTTVVIPVEGMSCVACAARVKKSLTSITGVGDVQVNLVERNARVRFDPSRLAPDRLVTAINGLGRVPGRNSDGGQMTLDEFLRQFGSGLDQGFSLLGLGVAFFARIVINLTLLGVLAGRLGALATESFGRYWALAMAILSFVAAAFAFWEPRFKVSQLEGWRRPGLTGAFGYGFIFSLGTSVAPLLLLLTILAAQASPIQGLLLAFTFGLGRGLPFLIAGVVGSVITGFTRLGAWRRTIQVVSGCALLFVTVYYARVFMALT